MSKHWQGRKQWYGPTSMRNQASTMKKKLEENYGFANEIGLDHFTFWLTLAVEMSARISGLYESDLDEWREVEHKTNRDCKRAYEFVWGNDDAFEKAFRDYAEKMLEDYHYDDY